MLKAIKSISHVTMGLLCFAPFSSVHAAPLNATGWDAACDTEVMDDMKNRAWMMAQREIEMNAYYIRKPDSVLEYSCYDHFVGSLYDGSDFFSETSIGGSTRDTTLDSLASPKVQAAMAAYLNANFSYTPNGGEGAGSSTIRLLGGLGGTYTPVTNAGSYACGTMLSSWQHSRNACENMSKGMFVTFHDMQNNPTGTDFRDATLWYNCHDETTSGLTHTSSLTIADNNETWPSMYRDLNLVNEDTPTKPAGYEADFIQTNYVYTLPIEAGGSESNPGGSGADATAVLDCTAAGVCTTDKCQPPIPTGLIVISSGRRMGFLDAICPNPGCSIDFVDPTAGVTAQSTDMAHLKCIPSVP